MNIIVDTSVWSLVLRRQRVDEQHGHVLTFRQCVEANWGLFLLGPILQELLDGMPSSQQFARLLKAMEPFELAPVGRQTYVLAAQMRNDCRKKGIQAGPTDFLIAAASVETGFPLLTADQDFQRISSCTELVLVPTDPADQ